MTYEEFMENETPIICPFCETEHALSDYDPELFELINNSKNDAHNCIMAECSECPGDFMINKYLQVFPHAKCRECEGTGVVYKDAFSPNGGHYEIRSECQTCKDVR